MRNKKVLYTIIILLIIFIPLTILGFIFKNQAHTIEDDNVNPKHYPYYNHYLWFYDNDKLISKYSCQNDRCTYLFPIINNKYVFILDGNIHLYDINNGKVYHTYTNVIDNLNNTYIVEDNNLKGIIKVNDDIEELIPITYSVMEKDNFNLDLYKVKDNNLWYIIDEDNKVLSNKLEQEIVNFNEQYLILNEQIIDYQNNSYFDINKENVLVTKDIIGIIENNNLYIYEDLNSDYLKSYIVKGKMSLNQTDDLLRIYSDDELLDMLALS